jgi:aspartate kinase
VKNNLQSETPKILVQKFGGSSLATSVQIQDVAKRVHQLHQQGYQLIVVVSAMGKTTDRLINLAYDVSAKPNRRELDMLLSTGERISMALMSMAINDQGCHAISFTGSQAGVLTDPSHSGAHIIDIKPIRVDAELAHGHVVVLAGFQGVCPKTKEITTLGRGGSDTTAVAMAAHFSAERCEIGKDVDGVYSADPKLVPNAKHLPHLHYQHLLEMTFWGAQVLHYRSVELAAVMNVPLKIQLAHPHPSQSSIQATLINGEHPMPDVTSEQGFERTQILSVNSHKDVCQLKIIEKDLAQAFELFNRCLAQAHLPWPQILDTERSEDGWNFLITAPDEVLNSIRQIENADLRFSAEQLSTVTATCQGAYSSALTSELLKVLTNKNIEVKKLIMSAMSITVLTIADSREETVRTLHGFI